MTLDDWLKALGPCFSNYIPWRGWRGRKWDAEQSLLWKGFADWYEEQGREAHANWIRARILKGRVSPRRGIRREPYGKSGRMTWPLIWADVEQPDPEDPRGTDDLPSCLFLALPLSWEIPLTGDTAKFYPRRRDAWQALLKALDSTPAAELGQESLEERVA